MVASSFRPFPRLPVELRLQIWNAACVFYRPNDYGVHYVDIEASSDSTALLVHHSSTTNVIDGGSKSACLMGMGLWMACRESRDVITRHSRVDDLDQSLPRARLSIRETDGVWDSLVYPTKDIFCIKPIDGPTGSVNLPLDNIALEFDPTWNTDLPESYYDLMSENSARGFLSRFFYNSFLNNSTTPTIWLIEKAGQWTWDLYRNPKHRNTPFHDYDAEYIQVNPYNRCCQCHNRHHLDGVFENITTFIGKLDDIAQVCEPDHPNYKPDLSDMWDSGFSEQFRITDDLRYLARRDKEVDVCTLEEDMAKFPSRCSRSPINQSHASAAGAGLDDDSDMGF